MNFTLYLRAHILYIRVIMIYMPFTNQYCSSANIARNTTSPESDTVTSGASRITSRNICPWKSTLVKQGLQTIFLVMLTGLMYNPHNFTESLSLRGEKKYPFSYMYVYKTGSYTLLIFLSIYVFFIFYFFTSGNILSQLILWTFGMKTAAFYLIVIFLIFWTHKQK